VIKESELDDVTLLIENSEVSKLYMLHHSVIDMTSSDLEKIA